MLWAYVTVTYSLIVLIKGCVCNFQSTDNDCTWDRQPYSKAEVYLVLKMQTADLKIHLSFPTVCLETVYVSIQS